MKISYKWLREYVDTDLTPNELDDLLTFSGLEIEDVEKVESIKGGLEHVVIAQVLTCEPHPDSDHLHLTTVDVGTGTPLNIVCGAPTWLPDRKLCVHRLAPRFTLPTRSFMRLRKANCAVR